MKSFKDVRVFFDPQNLGCTLHKHLKCPWCIQESKRNSAPLKQSIGYHSSCFYSPLQFWVIIQLEGCPCIGWIKTVNVFCSLPFSPNVSCIIRRMILAFLWMKTFVNGKFYVPSFLYQMFDTITSVEDHGDCRFKPSSSMKFNFFLTTMWYARKSDGSRAVVSQKYSMYYTSLLLLILYAQLFITFGEHKVQNNCSIHFLSLFCMDISVGSINF